MKALMKRNENEPKVRTQLKILTQLFDHAVKLHQTIIPLLPEDEMVKQNEWFSSIENYCGIFKGNVVKWVNKTEHVPNSVESDLVENSKDGSMDTVSKEAALVAAIVSHHEGWQDDVRPSYSISNVQSRRSATSAGSGKRSSVSGTSSARIEAEADLAALMARQKLLQDKHELEEEEQQLRKRKEILLLDEEIAAHVAKVSVLRAASTSGSKHTASTNAMNSYLRREQAKTKLNAGAAPFIPQRVETPKQQLKVTIDDQVTHYSSATSCFKVAPT